MRLPVLFTLAAVHWSARAQDEFPLRQLTEDNFRASTSRGVWLVEHFSPKCSHCRAFAPTWTRLAQDHQHLERLSGFHMAQVNCIAQGDLCNTNNIKYYPQLILYTDGQPITYSGDRTYAALSKYIEDYAMEYARGYLLSKDSEQEVVSAYGRPNVEGKVVEVDESSLERIKEEGPVLVDFFAPWCGHCKKLRPIYEELAKQLQGILNVVAVDCEANRKLCHKEGIQGYPTIRIYHHSTRSEYSGARTVEKLKAFALKAVESVSLQPIRLEDFHEIVEKDEAFFLYLQNFDTSVSDLETVKKALDPLLGSIPAYTSADLLLYKNLSIANPPPTSVLLAFSSHSTIPVGTVAFPSSADAVGKFVNLHRWPTLVQLTGSNYVDIMNSPLKSTVVLGALNKGPEGDKEREELEKMSRAWKRGGRGFNQPVWFVWVEGEKWAAWLKQSYGIKKSALPAVVVVDTPLKEYYDTTIEGTKVTFDGGSVFSVLEGFYQHFLLPKRSESALEWGSRSATMTLFHIGHFSGDHPLQALGILVGAVALFVFLLQRCIPRDSRETTPYGGPRLD
ncbi:hypothetical protein TREMEDRAFT_44374 [Tremella mesenterica DSM 1558]|uniref:uncharacterized protein n=1 Tax=Tremella mesenterica (strain ATCC 24925 / CBS 8224 / DSM 1558 / NBRC 9311 / NRRL Y-6157 / RJB 2259-6 / UBC 559-6) TaxID=578456 RepID=UPI0003F4A519|nr:uncharacterized protein TREMEDRAFT_44374 [Tremella mesenterica DSM 1558]EIW69209.1 hypothetical protein TREMEDRAFT_44374 [Tremella mesenterica DSM 1558]